MLHINLIGPMNLLPMNFIFDLTTKTHSRYITTLKTFILKRNSNQPSHILIRSYRYHTIILSKFFFTSTNHLLKLFLMITKSILLNSFSKDQRFHKNLQNSKFLVLTQMKQTHYIRKFFLHRLIRHSNFKTRGQEDFMETDNLQLT
ncbi:hypothetical protein HanPI659440_Chr15g0604711 [Helianthus annuus]|nr:hypothetical protein HanPI659440_Chr15g0604711 [Helianthus annuus]